MNKTTILTISAVFAVSMIAITAFEVDAVKPEPQAQGVFVDGAGFIQTFTCPDLSQIGIFANPTKFRYLETSTTFLIGTIIDDTSTSNGEFAVAWLNAEINENDFKLIGTVIDKGVELCPTALAVPSKVTLTGDCGLGGTSTLTTEQGFIIELNTDAVCG